MVSSGLQGILLLISCRRKFQSLLPSSRINCQSLSKYFIRTFFSVNFDTKTAPPKGSRHWFYPIWSWVQLLQHPCLFVNEECQPLQNQRKTKQILNSSQSRERKWIPNQNLLFFSVQQQHLSPRGTSDASLLQVFCWHLTGNQYRHLRLWLGWTILLLILMEPSLMIQIPLPPTQPHATSLTMILMVLSITF